MGLIKLLDKFNNSSKGKLIKAAFMLMLSFVMVVCACSAYAWFFKSKNTESNNLNINSKYEVMNASFTSFYLEELNTNEVTKGTQYVNNDGKNALDIKMLPYDMTFKNTNGLKAVVVRVQIYDVAAQYVPAANQTKNVSLIISRNTSLSFTTSSTLDEYFSSIGQVAFYSDTTLTINSSEETIYNTIAGRYNSEKTAGTMTNIKQFTTYSNSAYTKASYLSANMSYTTSNFILDENQESCLVFYICFDYNSTMADAYAEQESASLVGQGLEQNFGMLNDIANINVQFE